MLFNVVQLEILLHYRYVSEDFPRESTPAIEDAFKRLLNLRLIEHYAPDGKTPKYIITNKGQVHVEALCTLPLPEQEWVSPLKKGMM